MPELPEVETIRRTLAPHILGQTIKKIQLLWPGAFVLPAGVTPAAALRRRSVASLDRRGKYLLLGLDNGATVVTHFRMTGSLIYYPQPAPPARHTHVIIHLAAGQLHYADQRKFGRLQFVPPGELGALACLNKLGPEPLGESFWLEYFAIRLNGKKTPVKAALLDQTIICGLGNIYADEALFQAGILPFRESGGLKFSELFLLYDAVRLTLRQGIEAGGTTFRDYRDADGQSGSFQNRLRVYGRGGQPCLVCGRPLQKIKIGGRASVYCPDCQH
ncbi:MAG: bifunctional DNA-formamidopyrimidine glycosylase/DNA-(apurinic or apyrimidinic site) lyase [Gracilibacteraceae bacterium]|jgi:formamidopyrimidine-DNA glycosylase|nr:bifunctional DNA-formamidopyrimidine glycosylase/DNA-(apurinic or apyrimidinic site) lyase [Gracilibacteraceae bacterium]